MGTVYQEYVLLYHLNLPHSTLKWIFCGFSESKLSLSIALCNGIVQDVHSDQGCHTVQMFFLLRHITEVPTNPIPSYYIPRFIKIRISDFFHILNTTKQYLTAKSVYSLLCSFSRVQRIFSTGSILRESCTPIRLGVLSISLLLSANLNFLFMFTQG